MGEEAGNKENGKRISRFESRACPGRPSVLETAEGWVVGEGGWQEIGLEK